VAMPEFGVEGEEQQAPQPHHGMPTRRKRGWARA
jgi:hypothetical protein